jgi:hypothetical protein
MKKEYKSSRIHGKCSSSDEKLIQKIERVLRAWHRPHFIGTVLAAWRSAGFVYGTAAVFSGFKSIQHCWRTR